MHFPRPVTHYWTEMHPEPFKQGTNNFARYYGLLIDGLQTSYMNGFAYNQVRPRPRRRSRSASQRAEEVFAGKLWREQLREWDDEVKPAGSPSTARSRPSTPTRSPTTSWPLTSCGVATTTRR